MPVLIGDRRVTRLPVRDTGDPLVPLRNGLTARGGDVLVRSEVAERLEAAQNGLPDGLHLAVVEGYRSATTQQAIIDDYTAKHRRTFPAADEAELVRLVSRYVAPIDNAPQVAGAAVDLTLVDDVGRQLNMGTAIDATPEESAGRCYLDAAGLAPEARANRAILAAALGGAGLVNYPTEWWHWSFSDRYWAFVTGGEHAYYGPLLAPVPA
jgi:D-alanyl-D-alanine dipeptidase